MKILIIPFDYPSKYSNSDFVFVKNLVDEMTRQGHECMVLTPFSVTRHKTLHHGKEEYMVGGAGKVTVTRPNYLSTSSLTIGKVYVSNLLHKLAVRRGLRSMDFDPDVVYCHFWKQGIEAYPYARKHKKPLFVATGECEIFEDNRDGHLQDFCDYVKGVVCVSKKNKDESIKLNLTTAEKCCVVPNSIDNTLFKKLGKEECRKQLGLPFDKFIVVFVGWFENRKGSLRVSNAISSIPEKDVYSLFIGEGSENPNCENILYKGKVPHDKLPMYLNAADVFVLPTLQEGCCNAVIEAMACGLPIISSNLPFNWDVLNSNNSIMVNPNSVSEIKDAIVKLKEDKQLRESMGKSSLKTAQGLTISRRAQIIVDFMERKIKE